MTIVNVIETQTKTNSKNNSNLHRTAVIAKADELGVSA